MKRIGTKLIVQITLVLILVMGGGGALSIYRQITEDTNYLRAKEAYTFQQLSLILASLVYNMEDEQIKNIARSYLQDRDILAIKVLDERNLVLTSLGKNPETGDIAESMEEELQYADSDVKSGELMQYDDVIGTLEIVFSEKFIHDQVQNALIGAGVNLLLMIAFSGLVVLGLIRKSVTVPLSSLNQAARKIAQGEMEVALSRISSQNEIGMLSHSFEAMIEYIQSMASVATKISTGDLRHHVELRSEHDVLGQAFQNMIVYLNDTAEAATSIAAGDLRQEIQPKTEHDVLGNANHRKVQYLRQSIQEIMSSSTGLRDASDNLNLISQQLAALTEQTAQQTQTVTSNSRHISENVEAVAIATEEMSSSIREISRNTVEIAQMANDAVQDASLATTIIADLVTQSEEINDIITVITEVSQQTNLLALNATIEAARAGEFGKGFAVVASEIKNLSRETAMSAEDIIRKLGAIQSGSHNARESIENVLKINTTIREVSSVTASGVEQQNATTNEIARRMSEIASGSKDITQVIADVASVVQETSAGAAGIQQAAQNLTCLADQLQQLISRFKV